MAKNFPTLKIIISLFIISYFKKPAVKVQILTLLGFALFSFTANAQCSITGTTVNSSTISCATLSTAVCSIVYVGDGVNPTTLVMNQNLDLSCLGVIQLVIKNNANIDFSNNNFDLKLGANSSIIVENGGNISSSNNCSASDLIFIGSVTVASCNGGGNAESSFLNLVSSGGYNTVIVTASPSSICNEGNSIITATASPSSGATYRWYDAASGGSLLQNGGNTFNTGIITTTKTYYVEAYYSVGSYSTARKAITVVVIALPATPIIGAITQPTCLLATGSFTITNHNASYTYAITPSTGVTKSGNTITAPSGTYTVTASLAFCTSVASASVTVNAIPLNISWNGSVDENWNNASNWSCGAVPTISSDVLIPYPLAPGKKFPIITNAGPGGFVKNIEIQQGASVTIDGVITDILKGTGTGNALTVAGDLSLNGKIDLNGESQLVQKTGSTFSGTGIIEIDQQGEGNKYRYNYWSMPVYTANDNDLKGNYTTISASLRDGTNPSSPTSITFNNSGYDGAQTTPITLSTYWMYKLTNSASAYMAWEQIRSAGKVYTGQGFSMKGSKNPVQPITPVQNYVFVGTPNNGTIELDIIAGNDYLVGNPYPSAIDAQKFLNDNRPTAETATITGAIYFWEHYGGDTHNLAGYQGGYATYSISGGAPAVSGITGISNLGSSVKQEPKQYIAVGQAFFVVGDKGGKIQFNNGQRVFEKESDGNSIFMKNNSQKTKSNDNNLSDLRAKFRIGFDAPKISHRQLLLTIDERATPAVDWGFDAEIYEVFADDMYWMLEGKKYVIQATNEKGLNSEVPLGIQLSKTGPVTIKIDALENVDDDTSIYLKDKLTGASFNMREKAVELNLSAGKYTDRFVLLFKTQKLVAEDVKAEISIPAASQPLIEGIHVFMNKSLGELQIKNNSTHEIVNVILINAAGQTVKTWNSNFNLRTISLPISTTTGIYLVQINTKTGKTVKKISVK